MELSDKEKLKLSLQGLQAFMNQFPVDVYSDIVLDVLLDELNYNSEKNDKKSSLPLSGAEGQKRGEVSN